jgi:holo-[acyl-carrier protein] synthase
MTSEPSFIRGVGIDISDVVRFDRLCAEHGERFIRRWFTGDEIAQCSASARSAAEYSARFAAKESIWKALRIPAWTGPVPWLEISVLRDSESTPAVRVGLRGNVEQAALGLGVTQIHVDFDILGSVAVAVALVECGQFDPADA